MNARLSEETRSYQDPIGARARAAQKRREDLEARYPRVGEAYDGFYVLIDEMAEAGTSYFLGAEGIVGSRLLFGGGCCDGERFSEKHPSEAHPFEEYPSETPPAETHFAKTPPSNEEALLLACDGRPLARLRGEVAQRLARHAAQGWRIEPFISATFFCSQDRSGSADIAFICWAPLTAEYDEALTAFANNIASRLASGDRAGLSLSQDQFIKVVQSGGTWYLTPSTQREPLPQGTVVYKSRRTGIERLTGYALRHRVGCNVLASIFWIAVALGIIAIVWATFFR
jgi:hypothetical protein